MTCRLMMWILELGGLDASIMYELDRPQNVGEGMVQSLQDFNGFGLTTPFFGSTY
ncbi:hypothetical protein BT96DRAFT_1010735 [Gymnopus androsaceus JB14]|uniref:Uncharacterized protein n=1 Tax=Gymnopus androsaceus JB14 TaxID=1447944 RepID=A0A6A4GAE7_9AGAR|nr:hypothetical protein BT96DRAFT_1010735 [Gymnopus androsaceus JB14]